MLDWCYWINQPIFTDKGTHAILKRKHAIHYFVTEGLIPFLHSKGYIFEYTEPQLTVNLLRMLYALQNRKLIKPLPRYYHDEEQYIYFEHLFDSQAWDKFWVEWEGFQDFEKDTLGYRLRWELPAFVWSWVDLEQSKTAIKLQQEIDEQEYIEEGSKGKEDPYLQETAKRDYQDRHW